MSRVRHICEHDWCYGIVVSKGIEASKQGRRDSVLDNEVAEDHHDTNINGCGLRSTGGWFPAVYTSEPTDQQMLFYQVCIIC